MNINQAMLRTALVLSFLAGISGCSLLKRSATGVKEPTDEERLIHAVYETNRQAKYLEIRFTGKADLDDEKISFIGTVKIAKDSLIWVSLRSPLGIEIGRVLASRDSVWFVSKVLKMKEKGDWKLMREWTGYDLDFNALQGILTQSLFTAGGISKNIIQNDLLVRRQEEMTWIGWKPEIEDNPLKGRYLAQFRIEPASNRISEAQLKDGSGRWVSKAHYTYTKENVIKKIEINGMDESHNYMAEIGIVNCDEKDTFVINFERF